MEGEWIKVQRRRRQEKKGWNEEFNKAMKGRSTTFFFTRFPESWNEKNLWEMFKKYGAARQSDWKWTFRNLEPKPQKEQNDWKWTFGKKDSKCHSECCDVKKTFKDAIVGTHGNEKNHKGKEESGNVIQARVNTAHLARLKSCWVGKARNIFKQEGLVGCAIHYLGGLSILCEWQSEAKALQCLDLNKVNLSCLLSNLDMWDENLESPGRLTWLEIEGLPTLVWDSETAYEIGGELGVVMEIDDMKFECPMKNTVGVLVLTNCMDDTSRSMPIKINGSIHHIRVVDDRNRSILLNFPKKADEDPSEVETYTEAPRESEKVGECEASYEDASPSQEISSFQSSILKPNLTQQPIFFENYNEPNLENIDMLAQVLVDEKNSEGIKKKRQDKLKNKKCIFVVGKTTTNDDECQSKCDSSFSAGSDEAKKEIGKKLGIILDDENDADHNGTGRNHVMELIRNEKPNVLGIQETKMSEISLCLIRSMCGNPNVDFVAGRAVGTSGVTLLVWDSLVFTKVDTFSSSHFVGVFGEWFGVNENISLVNVYGPQGSRHKDELWRELLNIMSSIDAVWIFFGDFNAVRSQDKRFGTLFVERDAKDFNEFIANGGLHELLMGGHEFVNFGPKSFKLFNYWMENDSFSEVIENSWKGGDYTGSADIVLKNKIKKLKLDIKHWWHAKSAEDAAKKKEILARLEEFRESRLNRPKFRSQLFRRLDEIDVALLEAEFTMDEVKAAVWDCSSSKSPGLDGLNFKFIKRYRDTINVEFFNFIKHFETHGRLATGCNASFVVLVPKLSIPLDLSDYRPRRQPSGRALTDLSSLNLLITGLVLDSAIEDKWTWALEDSGKFSVRSWCKAIHSNFFVSEANTPSFRWNSWVPWKENIYSW
nr:hypothetical protein [Tanacetum cinerariifolium]